MRFLETAAITLGALLCVVTSIGSCGPEDRRDDDWSGGNADANADGNVDAFANLSYIWIANTGEGTLSKVDTTFANEEARYFTGPDEAGNDPSRTSVNLHGDVVVTNRNPTSGTSSVTKFAGSLDDCVDRNGDDTIQTSNGASEVLPWEQDECMLWNTQLDGYGARATAWDGDEDPETGEGGHVWIGTCTDLEDGGDNKVFKLDGDTGAVLATIPVSIGCAYGGAVDGNGGLWIFDRAAYHLVRVDMDDLTTAAYPVECGYGISVDSQGNVWTGGTGGITGNCVSKFDPSSCKAEVLEMPNAEFLRGIAVGSGKSEGTVWAADTSGKLFAIDEFDMQVVGTWMLSAPSMIGVAIDGEGFVWTVSYEANAAFKFDPDSGTHHSITIGETPYTYSDMTGVQLKNVKMVE